MRRQPGHRMGFVGRVLAWACAAGVAAGAAARPAHALTITGRVVNGTAGNRPLDTELTVVAPARGMRPLATTRSVDGRFTVGGLPADAPVFLVQVRFGGVDYREMVRPQAGRDTLEATVVVYESADGADGVRLSRYQVAVLRQGQTDLTLEKFFTVNNVSTPARTDTTGILVYAPADARPLEANVMGQGMPVRRQLRPTGTPGVYRIDYPVRPGETTVDVTLAAPYDDDRYTLRDSLLYDVDALAVFRVDPSMKIESDTLRFTEASAAHGMTELRAGAWSAGSTFRVTFSGGDPDFSIAGQGPGGETVVVPNAMDRPATIIVLVVFAGALLFALLTLRGARRPLETPEELRACYDGILARLARLDDLADMGAVPRDAARRRREDLKRQAAEILYRLQKMERRRDRATSDARRVRV